ncbi:hypothetical protein ANO11243_057010 [Dothideomycetidae sp. 11243]|nr:hypothetical protein ANO11243_057010 [fungal sp. No.11243]
MLNAVEGSEKIRLICEEKRNFRRRHLLALFGVPLAAPTFSSRAAPRVLGQEAGEDGWHNGERIAGRRAELRPDYIGQLVGRSWLGGEGASLGLQEGVAGGARQRVAEGEALVVGCLEPFEGRRRVQNSLRRAY